MELNEIEERELVGAKNVRGRAISEKGVICSKKYLTRHVVHLTHSRTCRTEEEVGLVLRIVQ